MKKQAIIPIIVLLLLTLTLIPQNTHVATATTEPSTLSSTIWSEFPPIEPYYEIFNPPLNGTYFIVYHTTFGDYYFDQYEGTYKFYYRNGEAFASAVRGILWYWDGADWQDLNYSNIAFSYTNNSLSFTRDVMYGSVKVGNHTTTVKFYKELKPKISFAFAKSPAWNSEGLTDFKWVFKVTLPAKFQWFYDEDTGFSYNITTTTQTFTKKKAEFIDAPNKTTWHYGLLVDWTDYGNASLEIKKGSTISVVFDANILNIDPSVVGTSTTSMAVYDPFQRKVFYDWNVSKLFWAFYSDGANMVYCTSTDGSTWTSPTTVRVCSCGHYFSVWFDGTYLHYAYASYSSLYYRRGTPNSDGTITWSAAEQTVSTTYNQAYTPMVSVDTDGYVWIGYRDYDGTNYYSYVVKSGNNDGTWGTTPSGFPYRLSTTTGLSCVSVIPLTNGKMLAVYAYSGDTVKAKGWDGSAWGTEVNTTSAIYLDYYYSAVAQGNDVHLTFLKTSTYDIIYTKYTYSTNSFGTETTLVAGATQYTAPVLSIDTATNDLYVFAATKTTGTPNGWTANHVYYIKYTASSGTWGSWTDWIDETAETLTYAFSLTCFYQAYGNYIGLVYLTGSGNVKFSLFGLRNLNIRTKDANGNILNNATVYTRIGRKTVDDFGWANFTGIGDTSVKVEYQDVWVNGTFTVTLDGDKTIDVICNVYSLTVKVQTASGTPISDCPLELWRDTTLLNGLYSLPSSPKTDSNGMFTWPQLANQSSSYTIKTPWAGIPSVTSPLTQDTFITITRAAPAPAPSPTPTPTPTPTPSPTPWTPPMQLPSPEQIKETFMQFPILIIIPISLMIVAYALIARRKS